jgi:hypothetical protein
VTTVDDTDTAVGSEASASETTDERRDLDEATPASDGVVPASDGAVPASDGAVPASDDAVPASDDAVPASDGAVAASDGVVAETAAPEGTAAETADGEPVAETDSAADAAAAPAVPVGAAEAATGAKPDPSASPVGDKLFTDGDSFNERLRDIALNFVDNPKEATAQAGALVDEAIEKVTSALKTQKDALAGQGDDTERLRVELRGYRDILKRISSL